MAEDKSKEEELKSIRERIDRIDDKIVEALNERVELVLQVKKIKEKESIAIEHSDREEEIFQRVESIASKLLRPAMRDIYKIIIESSKSIQSDK